MPTEIPLFPLRSVLCPGVALPLHIFEERYRLMIARCIERGEDFGVVLLVDGTPSRPLEARLAQVGTTAAIRRAGKYPDGRLDILTVGHRRFLLEDIDPSSEPYILGHVSLLDEPVGAPDEANQQAARVGRRFIDYLELLQPEGSEDGPGIEIEFEIELADEDATDEDATGEEAPSEERDGAAQADEASPAAASAVDDGDEIELTAEQRREVLMSAAHRLIATDDPTALSYVLTALIQVDLFSRQQLLEAPNTVERLGRLDAMLARETFFLEQGLRPIIIDPDQLIRRST